MKAWWLLGVVVAGVVGMLVGASCSDEARAHGFVARQYVATQNCVDPSTIIDVVVGAGPDGPACPPVCIKDTSGDVFVSGMCPPYPQFDTIESLDGGFDPTCAHALGVYNCNYTCDDAGGDASPPVADAACLTLGGQIDAGVDASADGAKEGGS